MKPFDKGLFVCSCLAICLASFYSCTTKSQQAASQKTTDSVPSTPRPAAWIDNTKFLQEKVLTDYIFSARTVKPRPENGQPFDSLDYDKLIAYDFAGSEETYPAVIDRNGKFVPVVLKQQFLTQDQADNILTSLASPSTYGEGTAACFQPHFALVFYKDNQLIDQINVCLGCNYLISGIAIPAETHQKVHAGTKEEYAYNGFTDKGRSAITALCKELGFTYGDEEENAQ